MTNRQPPNGPLRAFSCRVRGETFERVIHAKSASQAKAAYWSSIADLGVQYIDIRVRCGGAPVTSEDFRRTAEYRGVPFAKVGMQVMVEKDRGVIVSNNSSANFDVLFDQTSKYPGLVLNCHPNWEIAYLADDDTVICDFRTEDRK
jgi:hypothetical protein